MSYLAPTKSSATTVSQKDKQNKGLFGTVKSLFTSKDKKRRPNSRRLSIMSFSSDNNQDAEEEKALAKRRENCLAIRTAKTEPKDVQRLLIDCEFCNPQDSFGRDVEIITPQFESKDVADPAKIRQLAETEPETQWNMGLHEWLEIRDWWNTTSAYAVPAHHSIHGVPPDKHFVIYDKFVRRTRVPKEPINLEDTVKILKAGWVGEGSWPKTIDPEDVWSDEEIPQEEPIPDDHSERVVKFTTTPHPRMDTPDPQELKRIERSMSATSDRSELNLQPTRSAVSSLISITDDEG